jgi:hypothetical protein
VTADDPRYSEWSNRKPSKRKKLQEKILSAPGTYVRERAQHVAEGAAAAAVGRTGKALAPAALAGARALAPYALPLAAAAGTVAAAVVAWREIARQERILAGDRINQISRQFVATQQEVMRQYRVSSWAQVPSDVRNKLLNGYKAAIADVQVYHAGSLQPSKQIPYGR